MKKVLTKFRPRIRSRHPSHNILRGRGKIALLPFRSVVRLGSTTECKGVDIELNSIEAIKNSSNKSKMKVCFTNESVKTAMWWLYTKNNTFCNAKTGEDTDINKLPYPIISKSNFGSRGRGNVKHDNVESLTNWLQGKTKSNYIFEKFYNFAREYRLHVSADGCFYTCRKMLRKDTPEADKWFRNDANCIWALETNPEFDKPVNWKEIIKESVKSLKAVGLDFGAVDLRVQSATDSNGTLRKSPDFIIIEINSAPSFGEVTAAKYIEMLPKILTNKFNKK